MLDIFRAFEDLAQYRVRLQLINDGLRDEKFTAWHR